MGAGADILAELRQVRADLAEIKALILRGGGTAPAASSAPTVATDTDLDGKYGNPDVRKDPPRWQGVPIAPCFMADGPPEWLDEVASFNDWRAAQADAKGEADDKGRPKSYWPRLDAARARGWAARKRAAANDGGEL